MNKVFSPIAIFVFAAFILRGDPTPGDRAWQILEQALASKSATERANAAHALRLVHDNSRAREMVEHALNDPNAKVKAAAARALGPMGAKSSVPKLTALLADADPGVALAAAHSLLMLGERDGVYEFDSQVLLGKRKSADGFVHSQINQLRDPKVAAVMGVETGIGFVPFGSEGYEVFKRARKDDSRSGWQRRKSWQRIVIRKLTQRWPELAPTGSRRFAPRRSSRWPSEATPRRQP
jgi:hypothetical protein